MEYKTGFLFTINISQRDVLEFDLNLDLTDMAIYALFKHIAISDASRRIYESGKVFYQFNRQFIIDQLPIIGISTKNGISKRLQNLVNANILKPYDGNQKEGVSFFSFGEMHGILHDRAINKNGASDKIGVSENEQPINFGIHPYKLSDTPPINFGIHNNNTIDKVNNNKVVEEEKQKNSTTTPAKSEFKSELIWQMEYEKDEAKKQLLTDWAKQTISEQLPRILTIHGKQYTDEQLTAWIDQQLIKKPIELLKTKFTPYGHPLSSDTVNHIINTANWQLRERGGLDIAAVAVKPQTKRNVNYETPFK